MIKFQTVKTLLAVIGFLFLLVTFGQFVADMATQFYTWFSSVTQAVQ